VVRKIIKHLPKDSFYDLPTEDCEILELWASPAVETYYPEMTILPH
jgi:hypothetical protein